MKEIKGFDLESKEFEREDAYLREDELDNDYDEGVVVSEGEEFDYAMVDEDGRRLESTTTVDTRKLI